MGEENAKSQGQGTTVPTIEELQNAVSKLESSLKEVTKESIQRKERIREMEAAQKSFEESKLKEQNEFKSLYEKTKPKAELWEQYEPELNKMLETEIASVPEDRRGLIPEFDNPVKKMAWLQQARSAGIFSPPEMVNKKPNDSVQSKNNSNKTTPEFLSYAASDPRMTSLTNEQYAEWKRHNRQPTTKITGWGG